MLTVEKILPVVLVSIAAILSLAFMLTHFAEQITANAAFQAAPQIQKYDFRNGQATFGTKEVCVFKNKGLCDSQERADAFCKLAMDFDGLDATPIARCTSGFITCELPCGKSGANCATFHGEKSNKRC